MSITRTARGTGASSASGGTTTASITAAAGSSLIVITNSQISGNAVVSVVWSGGTFALDVKSSNSSFPICEIWSAHNVTGGTQTMTVTWTNTATTYSHCFVVIELIPTNGTISLGTSIQSNGSTNPATTTSITGTPNSGGSIVWVAGIAVARTNNDAAPTWTIPTTAGQKAGTTGGNTGYIAEGFEIDTTTISQAMSTSMANAAAYGAAMANYVEPAAAVRFPPARLISQAVRRSAIY